MRTRSGVFASALLLLAAGPALADQASSAGSDKDFMLGLRRIGVVAGQAVVCTPDATRDDEIHRVDKAAELIATEYGLRAAFNFIGAAGYGSGKPFDRSTCPAVVKQWTYVQQHDGDR